MQVLDTTRPSVIPYWEHGSSTGLVLQCCVHQDVKKTLPPLSTAATNMAELQPCYVFIREMQHTAGVYIYSYHRPRPVNFTTTMPCSEITEITEQTACKQQSVFLLLFLFTLFL